MRRLFSHRDARIYIAGQCLSVIGDSALWLAMAIWVKILTGSNSAAGLTFFAFVCGCLAAPVSGVIADRLRRRPLLITASLPLVLAANAAIGLCVVWINVGAITLIQRRTPGALLGRVDAALEFAVIVPQAASIALGAALIAVVNYRILLLAMAIVIAASAVYLVSGRDPAAGQSAAAVPQQADSMPKESAGTF